MGFRLWRLRSSSTVGASGSGSGSGSKRGAPVDENENENGGVGVGLRGDETRGVYGKMIIPLGIVLMTCR